MKKTIPFLAVIAILLCPWKQFTWQWALTLVWFAWFILNIYGIKKVWMDKQN